MDAFDTLAAELFVRPGDVVLDIGTHLGEMADGYLRRGAAEVIGFEPLLRNRERIPEALRSDPRFRLYPYALSDRRGQQDLIVPRHNDGGGSLSRAFFNRIRLDDSDPGECHVVELRTLDELDLPRASFWKIDVEGAELAVLRGAAGTLRRAPPAAIQVELFLHDREVYLATLDCLKSWFPHIWALGGTPSGKIAYYPVDNATISSPEFHRHLRLAGTPRYFATATDCRERLAAIANRPASDPVR